MRTKLYTFCTTIGLAACIAVAFNLIMTPAQATSYADEDILLSSEVIISDDTSVALGAVSEAEEVYITTTEIDMTPVYNIIL